MTITEFLTARIAEDEASAKEAGATAMSGHLWKQYPASAYAELQSVTLKASKRTLAECRAKRAIIEQAGEASGLDAMVDNDRAVGPRDMEADPYVGDVILRHLAAVYAGHPDYDLAWKV